MASKYQVVSKDGMMRQTYEGVSWTSLFFWCLPALFRKDMWGFLIMFVAGLFTGGFSNFVFFFIYNKMHRNMLAQDGWKSEISSEAK